MKRKCRKKPKRSYVKAGGFISLIAIGMICVTLYLATVNDSIEESVVEIRKPTLIPVGDYNPGDNSGFFYFMVYPHQPTPATAYAENLSNTSAYEFSDSWNTSTTGETPYSTTFDLVWKVGVTDEDGQWTSNSTWNENYHWFLLTCADLSIGVDTNISKQVIEDPTGNDYAYYHYYINDGGSGYTIIEGESFNITSGKFYVQRIQ